MKAAIVTADTVTTVSVSYAEELKYDYFAFGLSSIIRASSTRMKGIINGIDYSLFTPEPDPFSYRNYGASDVFEGKQLNKCALRRELGLEDNSTALIAMVTRLAEGKGIDLVLGVIDELLALDIQLVILGTGRCDYEQRFIELANKHPNLVVMIEFDRALSKRIYASADIFLMPSRSEPCGLSQMIACAYGTVPVVRSVGGLRDTIIPYGTAGANGFRFDNYNAHDMLYTVKDALELYKDKKEWNCLVLSALKSDFSWKRSANGYVNIYENLTLGSTDKG
jgi:starch synthase